jgi:hypothetical protein
MAVEDMTMNNPWLHEPVLFEGSSLSLCDPEAREWPGRHGRSSGEPVR